jgi:hypothetical protein
MSANIDSERSVALPPSALKNSLSSSQSSTAISSSSLLSPSISSSKSTASTIVIEIDEDNEELIRSYERFIQEMNQLQESITEFDDQECKQLRQVKYSNNSIYPRTMLILCSLVARKSLTRNRAKSRINYGNYSFLAIIKVTKSSAG